VTKADHIDNAGNHKGSFPRAVFCWPAEATGTSLPLKGGRCEVEVQPNGIRIRADALLDGAEVRGLIGVLWSAWRRGQKEAT
jgi:hypothetical protein